MTQAHGMRFAIFQLLLAIAFVSIAFLADARWGDGVIKWLVVAYAVTNGMIVAAWFVRFAIRAEQQNSDSAGQ